MTSAGPDLITARADLINLHNPFISQQLPVLLIQIKHRSRDLRHSCPQARKGHSCRTDARRTRHGQCRNRPKIRPEQSPRAQHDRLHSLFCRLDHFFDHRGRHQGRARSQRGSVRPVGGNTDPDRLDLATVPGGLDREIRWTSGIHRTDAADGAGHMGADIRVNLHHVSGRGARHRFGWRLLHHRRGLRVSVLRCGPSGDGTRHIRSGQRGGRSHQVRRSLCDGGLRLAGRRACLGDRAGDHGRHLLPVRQGRSGIGGAASIRRQGAEPHAAVRTAPESSGLALFALLFLRLRCLRGAGALDAALPDRCLRA